MGNKDCKHEWGPWGFSFEPGDGSFCFQRDCKIEGCYWSQWTSQEPDDFRKELPDEQH